MAKQSMQLDNETQVRNFLEDALDALRTKNAAKAVAMYAPGKVQFLLAPPLQFAGANEMTREKVQEWFDTFEGDLEYEAKDLMITAGEDIAYAHCLVRMAGKYAENSKPFEMWLRETICLRKQGGEWKIAHYHESVPFYMDGNNKAAVDLKP
ncbi:MAG TPA: nuclear transport factor 2 family protein [Pyrinomonadaceae bacterium]|jgi:ketosteroid isomerase-like protein|nr:nuclear transport factor 2 family protein [Pyrinomonadaceae bacterium]